VTKRSNYQKGEGRRAGAAEGDSITAWPDRVEGGVGSVII